MLTALLLPLVGRSERWGSAARGSLSLFFCRRATKVAYIR